MTNKGSPHNSVLLKEVLEYLKPSDGEIYLDCTFGAGGYSKEILKSANCNLISCDIDENVKTYADEVSSEYGDRFKFMITRFANIKSKLNGQKFDGIVMDLGVSSMQIDEAERGFSFQKDAPLDMRMGKDCVSAEEFINNATENEIADVIFKYGDEPKSREIARAIFLSRKISPIKTTLELAEIIHNVYGKIRGKIDTATKTFQAIRIHINKELEELTQILKDSKEILNTNGRLVVVTFHSLEDKIVKDFIRKESGHNEGKINKYKEEIKKHFFIDVTKRPIAPSREEVFNNVRARSAKLRCAIKC